MGTRFTKNIAPYVRVELKQAAKAGQLGQPSAEFNHLENAHVIGQESTYWHVKIHVHMFVWAVRNRKLKELLGQAFRITGAATKTAFGLVPTGNTGGANVSPFKVMPVKREYQEIIDKAKQSN